MADEKNEAATGSDRDDRSYAVEASPFVLITKTYSTCNFFR